MRTIHGEMWLEKEITINSTIHVVHFQIVIFSIKFLIDNYHMIRSVILINYLVF